MDKNQFIFKIYSRLVIDRYVVIRIMIMAGNQPNLPKIKLVNLCEYIFFENVSKNFEYILQQAM